jgi:phage baseplate assembly protein W
MPQYLGSITNKRTLSSEYLGKISRSFKDISFNFSKNPITNDIVVLKNEEAIKQSVKNLILTKVDERPFNPSLGTDTTSYLFELHTKISANALIEEIESVLKNNEPRITLQQIDVDVNPDSNNFEVYIEYLIVGLPPEVQNLSFVLVRES